MKHIVYGNGESRPTTDLIGGEWVTTWGCNAIIVILQLTILFQ